MKKSYHIAIAHIAIQLLYSAILATYLATNNTYSNAILFLMLMSAGLLLHFLVVLVLTIVFMNTKRKHLIKAHVLGVLFALLIGGSACFAAPALINS